MDADKINGMVSRIKSGESAAKTELYNILNPTVGKWKGSDDWKQEIWLYTFKTLIPNWKLEIGDFKNYFLSSIGCLRKNPIARALDYPFKITSGGVKKKKFQRVDLLRITSDNNEEEWIFGNSVSPEDYVFFKEFMGAAKSKLTQMEWSVFEGRIKGERDIEMAEYLGVSRARIGQLRKEGIRKVRFIDPVLLI